MENSPFYIRKEESMKTRMEILLHLMMILHDHPKIPIGRFLKLLQKDENLFEWGDEEFLERIKEVEL